MPSELFGLLKTIPQTGVGRFLLFLRHNARIRFGYYQKKLPLTDWHGDYPIGKSPFTRPKKEDLEHIPIDRNKLLDAANRIVSGELPYFSSQWFKRAAWNENPATGQTIPMLHWTEVADFSAEQGDIKWIWEASRFYWVYILGRAYALTLDDRYAEAFWTLLEDWRANNTPNKGPNWKCAQECSHRLCSLVWAAAAFSGAESSSEALQKALWQTINTLAKRVEPTLGYGISQNNNHALTESTAMLLAGVSCGTTDAARWERIGRHNLRKFILEQFAEDGSQLQSSFNYERLALKVSLVSATVASATPTPFPREVLERLNRAAKFLYCLQDEASGELPNYGSNDGAIAFPLCGSPFPDFRPIIQDAVFLTEGKRMFPSGEPDEELLWLFGPKALEVPQCDWKREPLRAENGGYYTLRSGKSMAMIRCHTHHSWPAHADMLHVDLWINGRNVAYDPGSYSYSDPKGWGDALKETRSHNTVTVDGQSQMRKARRFLWTDWTRSKAKPQDLPNVFEGEHYGYRQLGLGIVHRRQVLADGDDFLIVDDLINEGGDSHTLELNWHLDGVSWEMKNGLLVDPTGLVVQVLAPEKAKLELRSGEACYADTGRSLYYGEMRPATLLQCIATSKANVRFITAIGSETLSSQDETVVWKGTSVKLRAE